MSIRDSVYKDRSENECFFKRVESIMIGGVKFPGNIPLDEIYQWDDNIWVVKDKLAMEISKL